MNARAQDVTPIIGHESIIGTRVELSRSLPDKLLNGQKSNYRRNERWKKILMPCGQLRSSLTYAPSLWTRQPMIVVFAGKGGNEGEDCDRYLFERQDLGRPA
jgi:hypothetical protein